MKKRLTLSLDPKVLKQARDMARAGNTTLSALFTEFVRSLPAVEARQFKIGILTRKATGIMRLPPGKDYKEVLTDALMEKYGLSK